jgi:hypothetical protein
MSFQILSLLLVEIAEHPLAQHLREPDDGVERRPQLVGHVGQELGLVLAGDLELATLVLDLPEQPRVLDSKGGLRGISLEKVDDLRRELTGLPPIHDQAADDAILADQRLATGPAEATPSDVCCDGSWRHFVGYLMRLAV